MSSDLRAELTSVLKSSQAFATRWC